MRSLSFLTAAASMVALSGTAVAESPGPAVLYLNFSAGTESIAASDHDDATQNQSQVGQLAPAPRFEWSGMHEAEAARRILDRVQELFLPFNILVTAQRPEQGPYLMAMLGGNGVKLGFPAAAAGVAILDCENRRSNELVFVFPEAATLAAPDPIEAVAVAVAQEVGHAFGLEHSVDPEDIMFSNVALRGKRIVDADVRVAGIPGCGRTRQNSFRMLVDRLGRWPLGSDKPAPLYSISIPQPEDAPAMGCQIGTGDQRQTPGISSLCFLFPALAAWCRSRRRRKRLLNSANIVFNQ